MTLSRRFQRPSSTGHFYGFVISQPWLRYDCSWIFSTGSWVVAITSICKCWKQHAIINPYHCWPCYVEYMLYEWNPPAQSCRIRCPPVIGCWRSLWWSSMLRTLPGSHFHCGLGLTLTFSSFTIQCYLCILVIVLLSSLYRILVIIQILAHNWSLRSVIINPDFYRQLLSISIVIYYRQLWLWALYCCYHWLIPSLLYNCHCLFLWPSLSLPFHLP